jgi:hypothetical protein
MCEPASGILMLQPFFILAAQSPSRQEALRQTIYAHILIITAGACIIYVRHRDPPILLGHILLIAGIVEGAILIGWRLTQLPKSQAIEFLLVSPLPAWKLLLAEASVGLARLAFVVLSGLPVLLGLLSLGFLEAPDVLTLLIMPFTWGAVTGLGLTAWAYEPRPVRRWAERIMLAGIVVYLAIGVLVGENLRVWVAWMPPDLGWWFLWFFEAFHLYNPFAVMEFWLMEGPLVAEDRMEALELAALVAVGIMLLRAAARLKGHFHDMHYRPAVDESRGPRGRPGDAPLAWWAVRRVTEYSGRINLWLASGFGLAYALYTVAESYWPPWLGRSVFIVFEQWGGIPGLATALVVLSAVPAAFQYGLWDSNAQNRARRLELLLLTELEARDYWHAAAAAAWRRGRGYFAVALILWLSAALAGKATAAQVLVALASGAILWALYFVLGFRAFARGMQANGLGMLLTVGVPLLTFGLFRAQLPLLAAWLPPGSVYGPVAGLPPVYWLPGPVLAAAVTLVLARRTLARCDGQLRRWYAAHPA